MVEPQVLQGLWFKHVRKEHSGGGEGEASEVDAKQEASEVLEIKWRKYFKEKKWPTVTTVDESWRCKKQKQTK